MANPHCCPNINIIIIMLLSVCCCWFVVVTSAASVDLTAAAINIKFRSRWNVSVPVFIAMFRCFGEKCPGCGIGLCEGETVRRNGTKVFHLQCFACFICQRQLETGEDYDYNDDKDLILCRSHSTAACNVSHDSGRKLFFDASHLETNSFKASGK